MSQTRRAILAAIVSLTLVVVMLGSVLSADALNWRRWLAGRWQPETYQYLALPSPTLSGPVVDGYIRGAKSGGTTIASVTLNLSTAAGYYFLTRSSIDLRWASLISGATISVAATGTPATTAVFGGLSQGTGETVGSNLVSNGNFSAWTGDNPNGWTLIGAEDANTYITQSGNAARVYSTSALIGLWQSIHTVGRLYSLGLNVTAVVGGSITLGEGTAVAVNFDNYTTTGAKSKLLTATDTVLGVKRTFGSPVDITLTNISSQQVLTADLTGVQASALTNGGINPNSATYVLTVTK